MERPLSFYATIMLSQGELPPMAQTETCKHLCPVCGYELDDPPRDFNICPSCGTEFGLHDVNASILELRQAWIDAGPRWWSKTDPQPQNWNPFVQLSRVST
jgi:hypothetical protein